MLNEYRFGTVENLNCFEDETIDILYFPITDSDNFPCGIKEKAEELIKEIINDYEKKGCKLDISALRLNARIISFFDNHKEWKNEISVLVADDMWDICTEKTYAISPDNGLYESFKKYFMEQLESKLFPK